MSEARSRAWRGVSRKQILLPSFDAYRVFAAQQRHHCQERSARFAQRIVERLPIVAVLTIVVGDHENLPEVNPEVKAWVARVAPELAQVRVRELPEKTALDCFGRAAASRWGSIDVLTHGVFREACTFHFSREALRAVDAAFDLDLPTVIRGQDTKGQDFEMAAILAGRGKVVAFYDRDGIVYRNDRLNRDFKLASRVEFDTPVAGVLENIHGLCAKVRLFGCVRVRSMVKGGETVEVHAGTFTAESPLRPIQARGGPGR